MPNIVDTLEQMKNKKPAFDALQVGGVTSLVKQDLMDMNSNTTTLGTALINACPVRFLVSHLNISNAYNPTKGRFEGQGHAGHETN